MDGASFLHEFPDGGRLPERMDDRAALQSHVRAVCTACDEGRARDVDVAEPAEALLHVPHHDGGKDAAVQDGEDDVAPSRELPCRIAADEPQLLVLTSRETGEDIFCGGVQCQTVACGGVNHGLIAAARAGDGYECENIRCLRQTLHEHFSLRPVHFGSPFLWAGMPPLLSAVGETYRHEKIITCSFLICII